MRIGQLARKYEVPVQEIISYLEERSLEGQSYHPNAKLEAPVERELLSHFGVVVEEEAPEPVDVEELSTPEMIGEPEEESITDEPEKPPVVSPVEPARISVTNDPFGLRRVEFLHPNALGLRLSSKM